MFKFFRNLFKKENKFRKTMDKKLNYLSAQKGVDVTKIDDSTYSIAIDGSMSDLTPVDILRLLEGK